MWAARLIAATRSLRGPLGRLRFSHSQREYNAVEIEDKWRARWDSTSVPKHPTAGKSYVLAQFPYPSGALHMGHVRVYTLSDVISRHARMSGLAVLHPTGWDAFGLPAENAAIDRNIQPRDWTEENIRRMREQVKLIGCDIDWTRELSTCSPEYFRWTQQLFLDLFHAGLAVRKGAAVNWDPVDHTVLANEQVDAEGKSWRSGAVVENRVMEQWFFRTTHYASQLYNALDNMEWPSAVKALQRQWIGKSDGASLDFTLENSQECVRVFTTRPETVFGVQFVALAPNHPLIKSLPVSAQAIATNVLKQTAAPARSSQKSAAVSSNGSALGVNVIHPLTGALVPLYVADYVVSEYGTGAVMGVPAHDDRDAAFAISMNIPVGPPVIDKENCTQNSGKYSGLPVDAAATAIVADAKKLGFGDSAVQFRLRDWLVSRQRYWGAPIPIVHCPCCGIVPLPSSHLPLLLPEVNISGRGPSPLATAKDWVNTSCPTCKGPAQRDTDTMDTFVDSSWYFLRFAGAVETGYFDLDAIKYWLPVDVYVGGMEHATMHLLYARFITRFLHEKGLVPVPEPFARLITQGMVHSRTFKSSVTGKYLRPEDVADACFEKATGQPVVVTVEKMSKSKHNGVDPTQIIGSHGVDVVRLFMLFAAPPCDNVDWSTTAISGVKRWIQRVWKLVDEHSCADRTLVSDSSIEVRDVERAAHGAIQAISRSFALPYSLNTAVSELMKLSNTLACVPPAVRTTPAYDHAIRCLLLMLAPIAPHSAAEMWSWLSPDENVHCQPWPVVDESKLVTDTAPLVVQIMGVKRAVVHVPASVIGNKSEMVKAARDVVDIQAKLKGKSVKRVVVASKVVNFVLDQ